MCRPSYYPHTVRLFGYSSRNQKNKDAYVDILTMRMNAKHNKLDPQILHELDVTNKDVKDGLKLPINAYTGTLRAKFSPMFDNLQGFAICSTCQMLLLQLIHDVRQVPTVDMVSCNTDALMFYVDEEYKEQTDEVIHKWEKLTGHEMEEDKIVKIVMNNVNNYCELVQTGDNDYAINYKGGYFRGKHKFIWDQEQHKFHYKFEDDLESNSLTICSEALLKNLMFDIPPEDVIYNCNDVFRFQMVSHLGHTYEKCVQESPNGDIELQRNNRIYAGNVPRGTIVKIKADGRRDSVAGQPPNPVVDNEATMKIEDINKEWYVDLAYEWIADFKGIKRIEDYKVNELKEMATEYGIEFDKKTKKSELIDLIKKYKKENRKSLTNMPEYDRIDTERDKEMTKKVEETIETKINTSDYEIMRHNQIREDNIKLLSKINEFRKRVQEHEFIMDMQMDAQHGGSEYASIGQIFNFVQKTCLEVGLDFHFDCISEEKFEKAVMVPAVGAPRHLTESSCMIILTDIETGKERQYHMIGAGSDALDKGMGASQTMAFRNWFKFNFTPKAQFDWDDDNGDEEITETPAPKVPTFIPKEKKEEIKEEVVATPAKPADEKIAEKVAGLIMKIREKTDDPGYGEKTLVKLQAGEMDAVKLDQVRIKIENRADEVGVL